MNNRIAIQEELKELNSQLPLEKGPELYSVPKGYFEGFAASMLEKVKTDKAVTASDELEALAPLLAGISKKCLLQYRKVIFPRHQKVCRS